MPSESMERSRQFAEEHSLRLLKSDIKQFEYLRNVFQYTLHERN
jgi:hypothetical protein